ncbi:hypothetical protein BCR34DRAFT_576560 [Clohesyomyces aquaticus]|uniref:Uncharacterized protein n=1 Tax=Clohesyomyces aquaticus TaxID=1231657 RepID=A0A1Y1YNA4_9PLEO|nr:hypothetical protein BCR34DRAFT_576560 [Clohesyomyces aquaticus]
MFLLQGPKIHVSTRQEDYAIIPKRLLMAVSARAQRELSEDQTKNNILLGNDETDKESIDLLHNYLWRVCRANEYCSLKFPAKIFIAVGLYRACRALEMGNHGHTVVAFLKANVVTKNQIIEYHDLLRILTATPSDPKDPLVQHIANTFCRMRYLNQLPDLDYFSNWIMDFPEFRGLMDEIDARYLAKRKAWAKKEAKTESRKVEASIAAVNAKFGPGVHSLTAEQAKKLGKNIPDNQ